MRRLSFYLTALVLLVSAGALAACDDKSESPGTDPTPTGQTQPAEREYDLDESGKAAAELLGGEGTAAYAVLKALDSGYSPYQIAQAIDAGLIDESGVIEGVTPTASPSGTTLSSGDDGTRLVVASVALGGSLPATLADTNDGSSSRSDFEQMFEELKDHEQSVDWLVWLLGATGTGYSAGQITQYLDENQPLTDLSPPSAFDVSIIVDGDGHWVEPELPSDWAWAGRNALLDLQQDEGFDDTYTWLVIGMVNAGYSEEQIKEAWPLGIGLCSTQGDSSGGDAAFAPCSVSGGTIVQPAKTTPFSPAEIVIEDVIPTWPPKSIASLGSLGNVSKLKSGEKVSLKLTPYFPGTNNTLKITSHDVVLEIEPDETSTASVYNITGSWKIEAIETETDETLYGKSVKGQTFVFEGEFHSDGSTSLSNRHLRGKWSYTAYTPSGQVDYANRSEKAHYEGGVDVSDPEVFYLNLDEDLEGDGFLVTGLSSVNWDTFPGVEE